MIQDTDTLRWRDHCWPIAAAVLAIGGLTGHLATQPAAVPDPAHSRYHDASLDSDPQLHPDRFGDLNCSWSNGDAQRQLFRSGDLHLDRRHLCRENYLKLYGHPDDNDQLQRYRQHGQRQQYKNGYRYR